MAHAKGNPVFGQFSGKFSTTSLSIRDGRMIARPRVTPKNPQSPRQVNVRGTLGFSAKGWTTSLTQAQRDAWNAYAKLLKIKSKSGNLHTPKGNNIYVSYNATRAVLGLVAVNNPPAIVPSVGNVTVGTIVATANATTPASSVLTVPISSSLSTTGFIIKMTPLLSAGVSTVPVAKLRVVTYVVAGATFNGVLLAAYLGAFKVANIVTGAKIFYTIEPVDASGAKGTLVNGTIIVA